MTRPAWLCRAALTAGLLCTSSVSTWAKTDKIPPGQARKATKTQPGRPTRASTVDIPVATITSQWPTLGSWLDDAHIVAPGSLTLGTGVGLWRSVSARSIDVPFGATVGLHRRLHVSLGVPYYFAKDDAGTTGHNLGDSYLGAKLQLLDPEKSPVGAAVIPTLEILGPGSVDPESGNTQRVYWVLPLALSKSAGKVQLMATTGYFSRGALFASGAFGVTLSDRWSVVTAISHSYSTHEPTPDTGLNRQRTDASVGASCNVSGRLSVFASVGRTISTLDDSGARLAASLGGTYTFTARKKR